MKRLKKIIAHIQQALEMEKNMDRELNEFEDEAVIIEPEQAPELNRITLLHSNIIRAVLEQSRRFWQKLTIVLSVVAVGLLALLVLK